ncbi:hypothetical protein TNCV_1404361 [Trichonephila clavipes]|nr:hypothetical protein TNCV_1404361 [Trichonephila clavipes]
MHKKSAEAQSPAMERVGHESNRGSNDGNQSRSWSRTQCQHSRVADLKLSVTEGPLRRRADAQEICRSSKSCHGKGYNLRHLLAINPWSNITRSVTSSPRVASQWDMNQIEDQMMAPYEEWADAQLNVSILEICRSSKSCHGKGYNLRHRLAINPWSNTTRSVTSSPRVASQWDMNQIEDKMMVINQDHGHELNVSILGLRI